MWELEKVIFIRRNLIFKMMIMKRFTLSIIILFVLVFLAAIIGNAFISLGQYQSNQNKSDEVGFTKKINNHDIATNNTPNQAGGDLNSPDIDIKKLTFDLTQPRMGHLV